MPIPMTYFVTACIRLRCQVDEMACMPSVTISASCYYCIISLCGSLASSQLEFVPGSQIIVGCQGTWMFRICMERRLIITVVVLV